MNLTWHIVKKDLVCFRWAILVWGLSFVYLFVQPDLKLSGSADLRDFLQLSAMLLFLVLSVALISGVVQEDHPTDSREQWRTRPISPFRLLPAKLGLIGLLFIALPLLAACLRDRNAALVTLATFQEYGLIALVLTSITFSITATATCTKNVAQSLALWVGIVFATASLATALSRYAPVLSRQVAMHMYNTRVLAILAFSTTTALAIILNQYLRRRLGVTIALLVMGSIGSALIGTIWSYYYFYHS